MFEHLAKNNRTNSNHMLVIHILVFTKIFSIYMLRKPFHSTDTNLVVKCRNVRIFL